MTDLFSADPALPTSTVDETKNYLEELVGEGKKFKSVEDLARGKAEADTFIERLKREQEELRQELSARARLEELMDKLSAQNSQNQSTSNENNQHREGADDTPSITPERLAQLVEETVAKREQASRAQANIAEVKQTLTQAYGPDYVNKLKQEAASLGVTEAFLSNLAATQPKALYKLLGMGGEQRQAQPDLFVPPSSSMQSRGATPGVVGERTKTFYDKMKKENPREYWSPKVQNAMHQDAQRLGERFFT